MRIVLLPPLVLFIAAAHAQAVDSARVVPLDAVEVVGVGPLPGTALDRQRLPMTVQVARARQIDRSQSTDLTEFLNYNLGSIHLNTPGGNPLQPDVSFRGFQGSPLLGTPQGIAVYQDGVRINELFGDVVNWDMIPKLAVSELTFTSGSNPIFGLNALGGALSMQMKSGFSDSGLRVSSYGGSFGRFNAEVSGGGKWGKWAYFAAGQHFNETGWRDFSPSRASLAYGRLSRKGERATFDLSYNGGSSRLLGNGTIPDDVLAQQPRAILTHPDRTENRLNLLTAQYGYAIRKDVQLNAVAYARQTVTRTINGDFSPYEVTDDGFLIPEGDDQNPVRGRDGALVRAAPNDTSGINNYTYSRQRGYGASAQLSVGRALAGRESHLVAGVAYDGGNIVFNSATELGQLTADRGTIGSGLYDAASDVGVRIHIRHQSVYVQETVVPTKNLTVLLAGRLNQSRVMLEDQLGTALNGDHRYTAFNPSAGAVYAISEKLNAYASYAVSARVPTPVELTCADPNAPCRLPNSFLSDPPLNQVVAQTAEAGGRGKYRRWEWSAGVFRTEVRNDILFVSAGPARNSGYFTNVGGTRRQGLELSARKNQGRWRYSVNYTYLQATFRDRLELSSPNHPLSDNNEIEVMPGNRIPLTPAHLLKATLEADAWHERLTAGIDWVLNGPQYLRGDEINALAPLPTYSVVSLRAQYAITRHWLVFGRANNLLNADYRSFGLVGSPQQLPGLPATDTPRWVTPGMPRNGQLGLTWRL